MKPLSESTIQKQIIQYLSLISAGKFVFFSVPNESLGAAMKMFKVPDKAQYPLMAHFRAMGLLPGVSDLMILHDGKAYCMEVKTERGTQSQAQVRFESNVEKCGIPYEVVRSVGDVEYWLREWGVV